MKNKPFDLVMVDTRDDVIKMLNESGLPITAMSIIIKDVSKIIDAELSITLKKQREEYNNIESEEIVDGDK